MSITNVYQGSVNRLASQADAMGRLAQDSGGFAAVIAAFESRDPNAFRWVLERLELVPYCELICEWVRIKLCALRCAEICVPIQEGAEAPSLKQFAQAVAQLSSNEKVLRRVVDALACGDGNDYRAALEELTLAQFCHLICYWVCSVGYARICEIICRPGPTIAPDALGELRAAGEVAARLVKNAKALEAISRAAATLNCETLRSTVDEAGFGPDCEIICWLICVWRCTLVCRELCEVPPPILTGALAVEEAQNFALAARQLSNQPRVLGDLVNAVQSRDAKAYRELVARFRLAPYCWQLCAWVCSVTCYEFCVCVCPSQDLQPWFLTVGSFNIYSDIDTTTGRTNKPLPQTPSLNYHGGPNFAFFDRLQLGGFCPAFSPISPGTPMQYRFLYATAATTLAAGINTFQTSINVSPGAVTPPTPFNVSVCNGQATGETMTVTNVSGTTWTVNRGQDGTSGAAASGGATVCIDPRPITGALVWPVEVGQRYFHWPTKQANGLAGPITQLFQSVFVYSKPFVPPPEPAPPAQNTPWFPPPSAHYINADLVTGWIAVDPNAVGEGFQTLLGFDTTQPGVAPGGDVFPGLAQLTIGNPGGSPAGTAVSGASQKAGQDLAIIFQATRVGANTVDYSNSLCKIRVNNWLEVSNLWLVEFGASTSCCTPINQTASVQFTADHEEMGAGAWSLVINSCGLLSEIDLIDIPPPPPPIAGVTFTPGGRGGSGTIVENTSQWPNCSYTATLATRPGLTTGLLDRQVRYNPLTFCICGH